MAKVVLDLEVNGAGAAATTKTLKAQLKEAQVEAQALSEKFGGTSKEFINAAKKAAQIKDEIAGVNEAIDALHPEDKFNAITRVASGVAGGFAAAQGAMALFGAESEEVQQQLLKVQAALALSQGMNEIIGLKGAFESLSIQLKSTAIVQKALAAAQGVYNFVVGAGSVALKVFRGALIATGLGAIIVLIGTLVANFENLSKWVKDNSDKIKELAIFYLKFLNPFGLVYVAVTELAKRFQFLGNIVDFVKEKLGIFADMVIKLLEDLNLLDTAQEDLAQAEAERAQEKVDNIEKVIKLREKEIEIAKAEGKTAKELRDLEIKMLQERLGAYQELAEKRKLAGEEMEAEEVEKMEEASHALRLKVIEDLRITKEEEEKKNEERKKAYQKLKEEREKQRQEQQELERQIQDANIRLIKEGMDKEIAQTNLEFERKLQAIKGNGQRELELRRLIEQEKALALGQIEDKYFQDRIQKSAEDTIQRFENKNAELEAEKINLQLAGAETFEVEKQIENLRFNEQRLTKQLNASELELLEAQHKANLTAIDNQQKDEAIKIEQDIFNAKIQIGQNLANGIGALGTLLTNKTKEQEKFQKAAAVVQFGVDTAKAISSTVVGATAAAAAGGPAAPFLQAAYITSGIASVLTAMVTAKKALSGSGSSSAPNLSSSVGGGASAPQVKFNSTEGPRTDLNKNDLAGAPALPPQKVFVLETEMTEKQKRIADIEERAKF